MVWCDACRSIICLLSERPNVKVRLKLIFWLFVVSVVEVRNNVGGGITIFIDNNNEDGTATRMDQTRSSPRTDASGVVGNKTYRACRRSTRSKTVFQCNRRMPRCRFSRVILLQVESKSDSSIAINIRDVCRVRRVSVRVRLTSVHFLYRNVRYNRTTEFGRNPQTSGSIDWKKVEEPT